MLKKSVSIIAFLLVILFIYNSCIIITPAGDTKSRPSPTHQPSKKKTIQGKFQVIVVSKTQIEFRDKSGVIYKITDLSKKEIERLITMNDKWIGAEIEVLSKSKTKKQTARFIRFL